MNVKLIRIITGEEVVAELVEESENEFITVRNGLVVLPQAQSVGFMPWAKVIDKLNLTLHYQRLCCLYRWARC